jgi:hypothetical protein
MLSPESAVATVASAELSIISTPPVYGVDRGVGSALGAVELSSIAWERPSLDVGMIGEATASDGV